MAKDPMEPGSMVGGSIKTPMCSENVGRQNTPSVETYKGMPSKSGGSSIKSPQDSKQGSSPY